MTQPLEDPEDHRPGDKIRIRVEPWSGTRAFIVAVQDGALDVELPTGELHSILPSEITNYSRAARRAWQTTPKRAGRPRQLGPQKRMVSMRLDTEVWRSLAVAAQMGLIPSREQAVNAWLRERVEALLAQLKAHASSNETQAAAGPVLQLLKAEMPQRRDGEQG